MPRGPDGVKRPADSAQSERFIETAREMGADESGEAFDRAFEKIVRPKLRSPSSASIRKEPKSEP